MKIGKSVSKAIDEWEKGDLESAMLHACNAVDGTAGKQEHLVNGNKFRFTKLLRENYGILGPMGAPGIDLIATLFPVKINDIGDLKMLDLADVIYVVHRCAHGHGDELPAGFELIGDAKGAAGVTHYSLELGKVRLSDRIIFGLLGVVVANPKNATEHATDGYYLTFAESPPMIINEWWGKETEFLALMKTVVLPSVKINLGEWAKNASSAAISQ